jgi:uncharacterized protein (DUF924 family)
LKSCYICAFGQLDSWSETAEGNLALILLLDQMTRNIYRNHPMSFAGDDMALAFCLKGVKRDDEGFTRGADPLSSDAYDARRRPYYSG